MYSTSYNAKRKERKRKSVSIRKEEIILFLFADDMIVHVQNLKKKNLKKNKFLKLILFSRAAASSPCIMYKNQMFPNPCQHVSFSLFLRVDILPTYRITVCFSNSTFRYMPIKIEIGAWRLYLDNYFHRNNIHNSQNVKQIEVSIWLMNKQNVVYIKLLLFLP